MTLLARAAAFLPVLDWGRHYDRDTLTSDLVAAVIVTLMLIPQSLAYAQLAGLPAQVGLYASIAPLVLYALFGTSRVLAVGPVAVVSLMTATTVGQVTAAGTAHYAAVALTLAFLSGGKLLAGKPAMVQRIILHRMFVPRDTPKAEKNRMLRTMCDLFAVKHGTEYALRSKLK